MNITHNQLTITLPMRLRPWLIALLCSVNLAIADSGEVIDRSVIEKAIRKALPNTVIVSVRTSVIPGLAEIVGSDNILYSDPTGRYLMIGSIYDMQTATDITTQRKREVTPTARIRWKELPLETAVKYGDQGTAKLAVFFEPDCSSYQVRSIRRRGNFSSSTYRKGYVPHIRKRLLLFAQPQKI